MEEDRVTWTGHNEEEVFDFARPRLFRDYTDSSIPMKLRLSGGGSQFIPTGSTLVKKKDGSLGVIADALR